MYRTMSVAMVVRGNSLRGEEEWLNFNCANGMKQYLINYKTGVRLTGSGHGMDMEAMLV